MLVSRSSPSPSPSPYQSSAVSYPTAADPPLAAATYKPGHLSAAADHNGLFLSVGLGSRQLATSFQSVRLKNGKEWSSRAFHRLPDGAAVFPAADGGWVYVSNSEDPSRGNGGVGGGCLVVAAAAATAAYAVVAFAVAVAVAVSLPVARRGLAQPP